MRAGAALDAGLPRPERPRTVPAAFRDNDDELVAVKNEWDSMNLFSTNQTVEPTG